MDEYSALTGRTYSPVHTFMCDDAEMVMVGLGSVADDVEAVVTHLRSQGKKGGVVSIKLLQPFPEAEVVEADFRLGGGGRHILDLFDLADELGDLPGEAGGGEDADHGHGCLLPAVIHFHPDPAIPLFEEGLADALPTAP